MNQPKNLAKALREKSCKSLEKNKAYTTLISDLKKTADDECFCLSIPVKRNNVNYLDFISSLRSEGLIISHTDKEISISW